MTRRELLMNGMWAGLDLISPFACAAAAERNGAAIPSAFHGATGWINSDPFTAAAVGNQVILVDFWTYTCVNWRRTLPYIRGWAQKYRDCGLLVIGVHTPEFSFEHDIDNVRRATSALNIDYPVAVDSRYAIWRAFDNQYWPALYLVGIEGKTRYRQFGEGGYAEAERKIQSLLKDDGRADVPSDLLEPDVQGAEVPADLRTLRSPETYVGYAQAQGFVSLGGLSSDQPREYSLARRLRVNEWALRGYWNVGAESVALLRPGGQVTYRFHARDLNLVMGSVSSDRPVRFRVRLDGLALGIAHGGDVNEQGEGLVQEPRMYQLVRQPYPITDRVFEIEFQDTGIRVFDFTFG